MPVGSTTKLTIVTAIAAALTMSGFGCGDSGEAAALKKPQFVDQANEICRHAEDEREKALGEAAQSSDEGLTQADAVEAALPSIREMTEELAGLGVPAGDEEEVSAIVAEFEQGTEALEAESAGVSSDLTAFTKASESAEAYGLTSCGI